MRRKGNHHSSRISLQSFDAESATITTVERPSLSYSTLIANAIRDSPRGRLVLSEIYQHIMDSHLYYRLASPGWKNSVRHALSASPMFINMADCTLLPLASTRRRFEWGFNPAHELGSRRSSFDVRDATALCVDGDDDNDGSASVGIQSQWPFGAESTRMLQETFESMAGGISDVLSLDPPIRACSDFHRANKDGGKYSVDDDFFSHSYRSVGVETDDSLLTDASKGNLLGTLSMADLSDSLFGSFSKPISFLEDQLKNPGIHHCAVKRSRQDLQSVVNDRDMISNWLFPNQSLHPDDDWLTPALDSTRWSD